MALLKYGPLAAAVSGTIGGTVFSHNRGGAYSRAWAKPTRVTSVYATAAKQALAAVSQAWATLTAAQRQAWRNYCIENPSINRLGDSRTLAGHAAFVKLNTRVLRAGAALLDVPPLTAPPATPTITSLSVDASDGAADLVFTPTPLDAGVHLWVYACVVDGAGIEYVDNRLRLVYEGAAATASPIDFGPELIDRFGSLAAGQVVHARVLTMDSASGLISGAAPIDALVVT